MKKLFTILLFGLIALIPISVSAKEEVTIHVFYMETCMHCMNLHGFLDELVNDKEYKDKFNVIYYRLDNEKSFGENPNADEYRDLFYKVSTHLGYNDTGVPFYVIGDTFMSGYSKSLSPDEIKGLINKQYNNDKYVDVVSKIKAGDVSVEITTTKVSEDKLESDSRTSKNENNRKLTVNVGIGVIVVTIIAVVGILFISIKKL